MSKIDSMAAKLGVTPAQVIAGMKRNARSIRNFTAADLRRAGLSRRRANEIAKRYEEAK